MRHDDDGCAGGIMKHGDFGRKYRWKRPVIRDSDPWRVSFAILRHGGMAVERSATNLV